EGYLVTGNELMRNGRLPEGWMSERAPLMLETSLPCVFAAGDVRRTAVRRVSSAIVEGALAVTLARQALRDPMTVTGRAGMRENAGQPTSGRGVVTARSQARTALRRSVLQPSLYLFRRTLAAVRSNLRRGRRHRSNAQSMVEFSLVAPVLIVMLFLMIDFGRLVYTFGAISWATREGARLISLAPQQTTDCAVLQRVEQVGRGFPLSP